MVTGAHRSPTEYIIVATRGEIMQEKDARDQPYEIPDPRPSTGWRETVKIWAERRSVLFDCAVAW